MAELATIATVVQLADLALRMSGEVCKFLDAYKSTDRDVKLLRDVLRDVEANVRNLRGYIVQIQKCKDAFEEFENLSETIIGALEDYDADILAVKKLLPPKPLGNPTKRVRWVMKKRETQEVVNRISRRNSSLIVALEILGRQHGLRICQDTQKILAEQSHSDIAALNNFATVNSNMQRLGESHAELLSHSKIIVTSIHEMQASSDHQHEALTSIATQQARLANRRLKRMHAGGSLLARHTEQANNKLNTLSSQVQQTSIRTQQKIDHMAAEMKAVHSKTALVASSVDTIAKIVREEISRSLTPLIEQGIDKMEMRKESGVMRLKGFHDIIAHDVGFDIYAQRALEANQSTALHDTCSESPLINTENDRSLGMQQKLHLAKALNASYEGGNLLHTTSTYKRSWYSKCNSGNLEIQVTHTIHRTGGSPQSENHTSVEVHFWPTQKFISLPGLSLFYSTAPTSQGYYQLAPMVASFPIIGENHPVTSVIKSGDLVALKSMLRTGQVHLNSRQIDGSTLLHTAALHGKYEICEFLNDQGLSWFQKANNGLSVQGLSWVQKTYNGLSVISEGPLEIPATPLTYLFAYNSPDRAHGLLKYPRKILKYCDTIGCKVEYIYGYMHSCLYFMDSSEIFFERLYFELEQEIENRWPGYQDEYRSFVLEGLILNQPSKNTLKAISCIRRNRTKPDTIFQSYRAPLETALRQLQIWSRSHNPTNLFPETVLNVVFLIVLGADIYFTKPGSFDGAEHWTDLITYCQKAMEIRCFHGWRLALEWSRLDPDHVFLEDQRRRKQAFRLRGATRSGIDESVLDPPSINGLRCRRCSRRYCNNHDRSFFKASQTHGMKWAPVPDEVFELFKTE
ncbi:hypothetical protein PSV08DRAFT_402501 [Bipolaris maydis]|uniref:uncharacterized protein n=1 Tax=Cochliobolus heterostrophus TaxID=5016 RepID=UPI0024D8202F|nr:hypothetical protein J3E73DRAFT_423994 [Bipolaris maydis]KAJ6270400.1 hypothetical protein PSV08DRAFT_402501 [Bipolaris maydis]